VSRADEDRVSREAASSGIRFLPVQQIPTEALAKLFDTITADVDDRWFHPHPFTSQQAEALTCYEGQDLYYVAAHGDEVLAYGMLRGWDEGFRIPSLGIYVRPDARGQGLATRLTAFLHRAARDKGAPRVRLRVYPDNTAAIGLYEGLGYIFEGEECGQMVGFIDLR
jgi:ribosomal protein S18 acetylase RimI-like enzyme